MTIKGEKIGDLSFEELYRRYMRLVRSYFIRRVGPEEAADLTQETFFQAYRSREQFRGDSHDSTWLLVIAKNVFAQFVRSRKTFKRDAVEVSIDRSPTESMLRLPSTEPSALNDALEEERSKILLQAVASLPPRTRQIMRLAFIHGLKYREVAEMLDVSVNTVKSSVFQGKQKLRHFIGQNAPELEFDLWDGES